MENEKEKYTVLASRLPVSVKTKVEKFAKESHRTVSKAVHHLLETHQDLQPQTKESKQVQTA